jgi:hypothetical protein
MPLVQGLYMNRFIPESLNDMVFFYAGRVVKKRDSGWSIYVDSDNCLVSLDEMEGMPSIDEFRMADLQEKTVDEQVIYEGKVLFSGGVILTINDRILMLLRDRDARVDPLKWTSPAGRCDREPLFTSIKEFYEEVIIIDRKSGVPVFVTFSEGQAYARELETVYAKTLKVKGLEDNVEKWDFVRARSSDRYNLDIDVVCTYFGPFENSGGSRIGETFEGRFFTFFNKEDNTLELRLSTSVCFPFEVEDRLEFLDGEKYGRSVRLFSEQDFLELGKASLVDTMDHFRNEAFAGRKS